MAHYVTRRRGKHTYYSLEESYRDPITGKPRKRIIRYYGRHNPLHAALGIPPISLIGALRSDPGEAAADRAMEKAHREFMGDLVHTATLAGQQARFYRDTGLLIPMGPKDPVPIEKGETNTRAAFLAQTGHDLDDHLGHRTADEILADKPIGPSAYEQKSHEMAAEQEAAQAAEAAPAADTDGQNDAGGDNPD